MSNDATRSPQQGQGRAVGASLPNGPFRSTPEFDQTTLPLALQRTHNTKAGVWGRLCILDGAVRFIDEAAGGAAYDLVAGETHPIRPQADHHLELTGPVRLRVDFYDYDPDANPEAGE